jgi:N-methylhydantoinase A
MFGHSNPHAAVEVVNLRLRALASGPPITPRRLARRPNPAAVGRSRVLAGGKYRAVPVYQRDTIGPGARLNGPMVIVELSSTAYVSAEFSLRGDDYGNLHLEAR